MMNATNNTMTKMTILFDHKLQLVEQIVLASIFISALIGNTLVLIMLNKQHRRITRMAFFILHLTIADLLVAFFSVLPMLIWKSTITFFGGDFLCRIVAFLMLTASYISVYTLVVVANDRHEAIVRPLSTYTWTFRLGQTHMMGVWCLSLLLASPQLFIFRLAYHPAYEKQTCLAKFLGANRTWELVYIAWTIMFQFLLPICLLIYYYSSVYIIINRKFSMHRTSDNLKTTNISNLPSIERTKSLNRISTSTTIIDRKTKQFLNNHIHLHYPTVKFSNKTSSHHITNMMYPVVYGLRRASFDLSENQSINSIDGQKPRERYSANHFFSRARLKTIKLTFIVVLTYIICSTPFYVGLIIMVLHEKFISQKTMNWLMTIFSLLFNLNSCSNPIICLTLSGTLFQCGNDRSQRLSSLSPTNQTKNYRQRKSSFLEPCASL